MTFNDLSDYDIVLIRSIVNGFSEGFGM